MIGTESGQALAALYVSSVSFFALWRLERARRTELVRLVRDEGIRQRAALAELGLDLEDADRGV